MSITTTPAAMATTNGVLFEHVKLAKEIAICSPSNFSDDDDDNQGYTGNGIIVASGEVSGPRVLALHEKVYLTHMQTIGYKLIYSEIKRIGNYLLGPTIGQSHMESIKQHIARLDGTDDFFIVKIYTLKEEGVKQTQDDIIGRRLMNTESSLLSLAKNESGVIQMHDMFMEEKTVKNETNAFETKDIKRICLVLECFLPNDFSPKYQHISTLSSHIVQKKKLPQLDALVIFNKILLIVEKLHNKNIIHRDIKPMNITLNEHTYEVKLFNFSYGKHVSSDEEQIHDRNGSPLFVSPELLSSHSYLGKPADVWSLGIILFIMLYGSPPFYSPNQNNMFNKIRSGVFQFPFDALIHEKTKSLIKSILVVDPAKRPTATELVNIVRSIIAERRSLIADSDVQVVPVYTPL